MKRSYFFAAHTHPAYGGTLHADGIVELECADLAEIRKLVAKGMSPPPESGFGRQIGPHEIVITAFNPVD